MSDREGLEDVGGDGGGQDRTGISGAGPLAG